MISMMGTEAFDVELRRLLLEAGLLERRVYDVTKVAIHPDNREQEMAIPVEVQDLLDGMCEDGFNPSKWAALACTIPPGPIGDSWRQMNVDLILESDNFLAPVRADDLEIATARGPHGTCAIRCGKLGAKRTHASLAGNDGISSKEKICELAPSMRVPIEQGVEYEIIPGELALAVPI